jgi:hypothetical protein
MNDYQSEQLDALSQVLGTLEKISKCERDQLLGDIAPYVAFRREVDQFTDRHFRPLCTSACFQSKRSACCSKDGIVTFWADVVVNACCASTAQIAQLKKVIQDPFFSFKCIYLTPRGCLWTIRPLVCAFFLCDAVQKEVLGVCGNRSEQWNAYKRAAAAFRWPDKPVLFDRLEAVFMAAGCDSSLMYLSKSPGLLMVKKRAGII